MAKLIYERAIHVHPQTGELISYWPEHWPIENLARKWRAVSSGPFGAGYQNDPNALSGNALQRDWLHFYDKDDLDAHRRTLGVQRGTQHAGADPTRGGSGRDPDFFATILAERLENRCYFIDFFNERLNIDKQAQFLEDWLDVRGGIVTGVIEDTSEKGYVWNDLQMVNPVLDKNGVQIGPARGTKYPWVVEKAQGRSAVGAKELRYLAMAPRFKNAQIMIPGTRHGDGWLVDPKWDIFVQEWCAFPSGHDDLLDAAFWCAFAVFGKEAPASGFKSANPSAGSKVQEEIKGLLCERPAHIRFGKPLDQCARCVQEFVERQLAGRDSQGSQPAHRSVDVIQSTRSHVGVGLLRRR